MTTQNWNDFNDAEQQQGFDLIPKGTLVPVRMAIKPGGHDDPAQGWGGGYATESFETGAIYLAAEFVVTGGEHAKRKMWSNIGLHSKKGPTWGQMGRSFTQRMDRHRSRSRHRSQTRALHLGLEGRSLPVSGHRR